MADVAPFRAIRYAHPTPAVTAPPYDVLTPEALDGLPRPRPAQRRPPDAERLRGGGRAACSGRGSTRACSSATTSRRSWAVAQDYVGPDGIARRRDGPRRLAPRRAVRDRGRCCRTSARTPARRRAGCACCAPRGPSSSRSSCSTTASLAVAVPDREPDLAAGRHAALARPGRRRRRGVRRSAAADRRRPPPLRDGRRLRRRRRERRRARG